jgi:caffeoyl-CoA O-methyltransferase
MTYSTARVTTDRPERYIKQLVSHLGNRVPTELAEDGRGTITLRSGQCVLTADPSHLDMVATAQDAEALAEVQDVITRHLLRFAARDELVVDWAPSSDNPVG